MTIWSGLAVITLILTIPLALFVTFEGVRKQRSFESSGKLIESALVMAERSSIVMIDAHASLKEAVARIKELEVENARLRARIKD